jgi:hypothetical protein
LCKNSFHTHFKLVKHILLSTCNDVHIAKIKVIIKKKHDF